MNMKWLYRIIPILAIITLAIPHAPIQAMSTWADTDYPYRFEVTVESDYVDVDESFPFVIDDAPEHFWSNVQEDGADILVCAEDKTKLYAELATWSYLFHDIELWVNGELSSTVDTVFYVYYGIDIEWEDNDYTGITGSLPAQSVWDSNYVFVSHMNDNPADSSQILDSTSNANHGTKGAGTQAPTEVNGLVGKAQSFDGGQIISLLNSAPLTMGDGDYTIEQVIYHAISNDEIVNNERLWITGAGGGLETDAGFMVSRLSHRPYQYYFTFCDGITARTSKYTQAGSLLYQDYVHLSMVFDRDGYLDIIQNGLSVGNLDISSYTGDVDTYSRGFDVGGVTSEGFNGLNDELRISKKARDGGWIGTTNNSMQESGFTVTGDYTVYPCVATNFNYSNLISQQNYASIDLSWDYCADEIEYTVVRSETWYPLDPLDGEVRYSGSLLGFTDSFTPGENTYYYSIFSTTDLGTNSSYSTLLVNMPMTPIEVGGNMMWVIIPIVIAGGIVIYAVRANIHMGQGRIKPDAVMRGIAIGLVALVAILAMLGVL